MSQHMKTAGPAFALLVPSTKNTDLDEKFLELCGERWILKQFEHISDAPPFTCVSYSWGPGRVNNPFEDGHLISDRTFSALEAVINASKSAKCWKEALSKDGIPDMPSVEAALDASRALWVDVFCVPHEKLAREACLRNMGNIYSSAHQVLAVFSTRCTETFRKIRRASRESGKLVLQYLDLLSLNENEWITRAWTYQEIAICNQIFFVTEGDGTVLLNRIEFLDAIVDATTDYTDAEGIERIKLASIFPNLDSLEEVYAELQVVEYAGRPAFQIMSAMHQRKAERDADRIYAMLGVLTTTLPDISTYTILSPSEIFIQLCEEKKDFSYIFSTGSRSEKPGESWRPVSDQFTPVISGLLATGSGLSATVRVSHLEMENMCCMKVGKVNPVLSALSAFIGKSFPGQILDILKLKGFTGCGQYLSLENGYFFPQSSCKNSKDCIVAISNEVVFTQGAPALLLRPNGEELYEFVDVGVFIGRSSTSSETLNVC